MKPFMKSVLYNTILILAIISLCAYSYLSYNKYYPSITALKENPLFYDGRTVEFRSGDITKLNEEEKTLIYTSGKEELKISYDKRFSPRATNKGQTSILVNVNNGNFELADIHNHDNNYWKYIISVFCIVIFIYYFFKEWSLDEFRLIPKQSKSGGKNA